MIRTSTSERPPDYGQLLHPQERRGPALAKAQTTEPLPLPFHADQQFVVESGRTVLCLDHERMIGRGTFHSAAELEQAIYKWLAEWNGSPAPFAGKAPVEVILDKVATL
jgi:hypothetical protein